VHLAVRLAGHQLDVLHGACWPIVAEHVISSE
jgi:hypothetical protein